MVLVQAGLSFVLLTGSFPPARSTLVLPVDKNAALPGRARLLPWQRCREQHSCSSTPAPLPTTPPAMRCSFLLLISRGILWVAKNSSKATEAGKQGDFISLKMYAWRRGEFTQLPSPSSKLVENTQAERLRCVPAACGCGVGAFGGAAPTEGCSFARGHAHL